jgi:hypothetical protein
VTLQTSPLPNLSLVLDTQDVVAPYTIEGIVNFVRVIGPVEPQLMPNGRTYRWLSWSDGGARTHEIRLGVAGLTTYAITAYFGCDVIQEATNLRLQSSGPDSPVTLTWNPVVDACLRPGPSRYQIYAASTARPSVHPGSFPNDPGFTLVGETMGTSFTYEPLDSHRYFVVVAIGTDNLPGKAGHYGR